MALLLTHNFMAVGLAFYNQGDLKSALAYYSRAQKTLYSFDNPNEIEKFEVNEKKCFEFLLAIYKQSNNTNGAMALFTEKYRRAKDQKAKSQVYYEVGCYYRDSDIEKALEYFTKAINKVAPEVAVNAFAARGLLYWSKGKYKESHADYLAAAKGDINNQVEFQKLEMCFRKQQQQDLNAQLKNILASGSVDDLNTFRQNLKNCDFEVAIMLELNTRKFAEDKEATPSRKRQKLTNGASADADSMPPLEAATPTATIEANHGKRKSSSPVTKKAAAITVKQEVEDIDSDSDGEVKAAASSSAAAAAAASSSAKPSYSPRKFGSPHRAVAHRPRLDLVESSQSQQRLR